MGDEEELELAPPVVGPFGGSQGERVEGVDGGDLLPGDGMVGGFVVAVAVVDAVPTQSAEQVLVGEEVAFVEASVDEPADAALDVGGDRLTPSEQFEPVVELSSLADAL